MNGQYEGETRNEFFKRQVIECEQWIATESAIQKQSRESRANHAKKNICPSKSKHWCKIFKWEGEDEQVREIIYHRAWSLEWENYADSQHYYHDYCNEWDLCEAFDPGALPNYDMDDEDDIIPPREPSPDPPPPYPPSSPAPPPISVVPGPAIWRAGLPDQPDPISLRDKFLSLQTTLRMRYGLIDSGVTIHHNPSITIHASSKTLRVVGYYKSSTAADLSPNASYFISLLLLCPFVESEFGSIPQALTDTTQPSAFLPNP